MRSFGLLALLPAMVSSAALQCESSPTLKSFVASKTDPLIARQYSNGLAADTIKGCDVQVFADESKQSDFRIARLLAKILE